MNLRKRTRTESMAYLDGVRQALRLVKKSDPGSPAAQILTGIVDSMESFLEKEREPVSMDERIALMIRSVHPLVGEAEGALVFLYDTVEGPGEKRAAFASTGEDRCDLLTMLIEWIGHQDPAIVELAFQRFSDIRKHGPEQVV